MKSTITSSRITWPVANIAKIVGSMSNYYTLTLIHPAVHIRAAGHIILISLYNLEQSLFIVW